jgi:hypothetical protein
LRQAEVFRGDNAARSLRKKFLRLGIFLQELIRGLLLFAADERGRHDPKQPSLLHIG